MSWEVLTMKSRISFFNTGLCKNFLRRCWPLWVVYFAVLFLELPAMLNAQGRLYYSDNGQSLLYQAILNSGELVVITSFFACIAVAMAMFSYLYSSRSCGMMNTLPIRRETMFGTAWLTGFVPMLLAALLVAGITALMHLGEPEILGALPQWLGMVVMTLAFFYGAAVFCAMLTGSLLILPLVYVVLNFAAYVAEVCFRYTFARFVFGMWDDVATLRFLSPPIVMMRDLRMEWLEDGRYVLQGLGVLAIYAAVGLVLSLLALLLYRRRNMETATDVVAIPILKPVFKYCLSAGCALVFSGLMFNMFILGDGGYHGGAGTAALALGIMLVGAFVGYFAAEMLLQKTVKVFTGKWKGFAAVCAALALLVICAETDLFRVERWTPDPEKVESISFREVEIHDPENIRAFVEVQKQIIANKTANENAPLCGTFYMAFHMKDGRTVLRNYPVDTSREKANDPDSDIAGLQRLMNSRECMDYRMRTGVPIEEENVQWFALEYRYVDREGKLNSEELVLNPDQAVDFYENCLLPDIRDGHMGRSYLAQSDESDALTTNVNVTLDLVDRNKLGTVARMPHEAYTWFYLTVYADAERCLEWIRENTDIEVVSQRSLQEELDEETAMAVLPVPTSF